MSLHHAPPATVDGRVSLLEAKQMLDSQQIWALRSELPSDVLRMLDDVQLHVQHDQEQDDKVRELTSTVQQLEQRLAAIETLLRDSTLGEGGGIPVAPMQVAPLELPTKKQARKKPLKPQSSRRTRAAKSARVAEVP